MIFPPEISRNPDLPGNIGRSFSDHFAGGRVGAHQRPAVRPGADAPREAKRSEWLGAFGLFPHQQNPRSRWGTAARATEAAATCNPYRATDTRANAPHRERGG